MNQNNSERCSAVAANRIATEVDLPNLLGEWPGALIGKVACTSPPDRLAEEFRWSPFRNAPS